MAIGRSELRREDPALLLGTARFVADLAPPDCLVASFVRSSVAHAVLERVEVSEARDAPGVVAVFTAADLALPLLPEFVAPPAQPRPLLGRPCLAVDRVRFVGEAVAVVVATSAAAAVDAAELVEVDYAELDAVVSAEVAVDSPVVLFPEFGTNVVVDLPPDQTVDIDAAPVVVRASFLNQRVAPAPLETNGALAAPGPDGTLEFWVSTQAPFAVRAVLCELLGMTPDQVRVVAPQVGGGFGAKGGTYPEHVVLAAVARRLGRPVIWQETRSESFVAMTHGRDQLQHIELAAEADGTVVGLRASTITNVGAYAWRGGIGTRHSRLMASGVYRIPRIEIHSRAVVTNTSPVGPYRGAGRPEAAALIERAMDLLAVEVGVDPAEIRRRNFIRPGDFPYATPTGAVYDSGDYARALDQALELVGYGDLRDEQARRREAGDPVAVGVGISTFTEVSGGAWEYGGVRIEADGSVTVHSGSAPHGQGHETTFAQVAAEVLGVGTERVRVLHSDTSLVARGFGTFGSRSVQMAGSAIHEAGEKVVAMARDLAADLLEAAPEDVVVADGRLSVAGVPSRSLSWADLAGAVAARATPPGAAATASPLADGLAAESVFAVADGGTYPFGAHIAVVDVDTETGKVRLRRLVAVDDCGRVINPMLVAGQIHGGLAQGVGQALLEGVVYDDAGTPLTSTFLDYCLPSAADLPTWELGHTETLTSRNPLGAKGTGEAGTVGGAVAVQNAVLDALRPFGVDHLDMPLTPQRVWRALAGRSGSAAR